MSKILVVDDDDELRAEFRTFLTFANHRVLEACRADEAVAIAEAEDVDVVLMDIRLPGYDGLRAAEMLSALDRRCQIIFMSCDAELLRKAEEKFGLSIAAYSKPIDIRALTQFIAGLAI